MSLNLIKSFTLDSKRLSVYGTINEPLFLAKEVGEFLGLSNIRMTLSTIQDDWKVVNKVDTPGGKQAMTYLKEPALYKIAFRSNKDYADKFTNWVASEVLPVIRRTGEYKAPERTQCKPQLTFKIETEADLHFKVVNFIKNIKAYDLIILPSLGEFQNDKTKRIEAFRKGYLKGTPDLIMLNPNKNYSGLAIEFKSPLHGGITSEFQFDMFDKYKKLGYKVIHSNNYDDIIMAIYDYVKEIRIVCQYCPRKFRNKDMLENHQKWVHRDKKIK